MECLERRIPGVYPFRRPARRRMPQPQEKQRPSGREERRDGAAHPYGPRRRQHGETRNVLDVLLAKLSRQYRSDGYGYSFGGQGQRLTAVLFVKVTKSGGIA